ncbi:pilus assembly protein TadG-related protein [Nocardioides insulae]|uniref:pilus assembly protein TadG-related protein n=1 Tax=Nocardioides insulae TaxID=394734 RepID=UPI0004223790|nr:pilus assembly protein TadG-related protein [Nocardioides insulae]
MTPRRHDERGSATPLIVGFAMILLLLVAVVVDASAAYLQRSGLSSIADGAALAGTESVDVEDTYVSGLSSDPRLVAAEAEAAVAAYLREVGARGSHPGLRVTRLEVTEDRVTVRISAPLRLPLGMPGLGDASTVASTGSAQLTTY